MLQDLNSCLVAMRPKHWIKNLLVFALPLSDGRIIGSSSEVNSILRGLIVFTSLSAISSANYILNDLKDIDEDRKHNIKKFRPFAAGELSIKIGICLSALLVFFSLGTSALLGNLRTSILIVFFGVLQFLYTLLLKNLSGYDLVTLATLYVYRAVLPAAYEEISLSKWFLVFFFAGALFLASGKRYSEFRHSGKGLQTRKVLSAYTELQLALWIAISLSLLIFSYLNWIFTFSSNQDFLIILASLIPMCIVLIRVSFLTMSEEGEDPTKIIFRNKDNIILIAIWLMLYLIAKGYL